MSTPKPVPAPAQAARLPARGAVALLAATGVTTLFAVASMGAQLAVLPVQATAWPLGVIVVLATAGIAAAALACHPAHAAWASAPAALLLAAVVSECIVVGGTAVGSLKLLADLGLGFLSTYMSRLACTGVSTIVLLLLSAACVACWGGWAPPAWPAPLATGVADPGPGTRVRGARKHLGLPLTLAAATGVGAVLTGLACTWGGVGSLVSLLSGLDQRVGGTVGSTLFILTTIVSVVIVLAVAAAVATLACGGRGRVAAVAALATVGMPTVVTTVAGLHGANSSSVGSVLMPIGAALAMVGLGVMPRGAVAAPMLRVARATAAVAMIVAAVGVIVIAVGAGQMRAGATPNAGELMAALKAAKKGDRPSISNIIKRAGTSKAVDQMAIAPIANDLALWAALSAAALVYGAFAAHTHRGSRHRLAAAGLLMQTAPSASSLLMLDVGSVGAVAIALAGVILLKMGCIGAACSLVDYAADDVAVDDGKAATPVHNAGLAAEP